MTQHSMKAWRLERMGGALSLEDAPMPEVRSGSVLVRVEASLLVSYIKPYVDGHLPFYLTPSEPFTPVGNGVGVVEAVGRDVWIVKPGQRAGLLVKSAKHGCRNDERATPKEVAGIR